MSPNRSPSAICRTSEEDGCCPAAAAGVLNAAGVLLAGGPIMPPGALPAAAATFPPACRGECGHQQVSSLTARNPLDASRHVHASCSCLCVGSAANTPTLLPIRSSRLPVLTGSSTVIVREGLSAAPAAALNAPAPAAAGSAPPRRVAALGGAGVLKLLASAAAAAGCFVRCFWASAAACAADRAAFQV